MNRNTNEMNPRNPRFQAIDAAELELVTGGGLVGWIAKGAQKTVELAKWTGIPAAIGAGAAWVKHQFDNK